MLRERVVYFRRVQSWSGMTIYPWIFLFARGDSATLTHERVHWIEQNEWWEKAGPFGVLAWLLCYLLLLPVGWNRFRWNTEMRAYLADGTSIERATDLLRTRYALWWMNG